MNPLTVIKEICIKNTDSIILTDEIRDIHNVLESTNSNIFITGKAGTGKSTIIQYFRNNTKKKIVVLAPTGLAAINVQGQTIHSFFRFPPQILTQRVIPLRNNKILYRHVDTIVIDEISMVRADIIDGIDHFLRIHGRDKERPFGGVQMIFVGDVYQLPPIVTYSEVKTKCQIWKGKN